MTEQAIQSKIKKRLTKSNWIVLKLTVVSFSGFPDLICLKNPGIAAFIEVKRPGNEPTRLQRYWMDKLRDLGFDVRVACSMEDINDMINT